MENKRKKITTAVIASVTAVALLLGGTFAWQSISQTALNEKEAVINPGGRLHDDFNGENKDVYVENFADDDIFARVRLNEYFEIVMNKNTPAEKTEVVTTGATKADTSTYPVHKFGEDNATDDYWQWITGGQKYYMPTFNKNKDSLVADINGTFAENYEDYVEYEQDETKESSAIYDSDTNSVDEVRTDLDNLSPYVEAGNIKTVTEIHTAKETGEASLISMEEWLQLVEDGEDTSNFWVYDTDGWVYWSSPIKAGTATGLLLDEIELKNVMNDSYYYAIEVTGQFITADDLGKDDNTGFYDTTAGSAPSKDALTLLEKIGVDVGNADDDNNDDVETQNAEIQIALYNEDGTKVAGHGAGSTLAANSTYDIVATVRTQSGDYVVSDSRSGGQVSDKVEATVNVYASAYDSDNSTYNCVNSDGKLVTGNADTFDYTKVEDGVYKSLSVCATVSDITVNGTDSYNDVETEYSLYPTGKEVLKWKDGQDVLYASPNRKSSDPFKIFDGNGNDITFDSTLKLSIKGATDSNTKFNITEKGAVLTIGDNETVEDMYLVAENKNGKGERLFSTIYIGILTVDGKTIYPYGTISYSDYETITISKTNGIEITCYDYWGNKLETKDVVYTIEDYVLNWYPGAYVENGILHINEIASNAGFSVQAKYDSTLHPIDYSFKVELTD